ncbi:MAG TPA: hypothetical protein VHG89_11320 [Verrucomicrobiae bacterium]|nr:hypothetical protein [Verrucomicrobiae bacterium]
MVLLCCLCFLIAGCGNNDLKVKQSGIADTIEKIPASKIKLFIYSLNPDDLRIYSGKTPENSDKVFHNYPILGSAEIIPIQEKESLLKNFADGIREFHQPSACILEPRHGLRIISDSETNDFAICFKCGDVAAYNFDLAQNFTIGSSSKTVFDNFLDEYKLEKAK